MPAHDRDGSPDSLTAYRARRSPDRSPEPVGSVSPVAGNLKGKLLFELDGYKLHGK